MIRQIVRQYHFLVVPFVAWCKDIQTANFHTQQYLQLHGIHCQKDYDKNSIHIETFLVNDTKNICMIVIASHDTLMDSFCLHGLTIGYFQCQLHHFVIATTWSLVINRVYFHSKEMDKIAERSNTNNTNNDNDYNIKDNEAKIYTQSGGA